MKDNWLKFLKKRFELMGFKTESHNVELNKQEEETFSEMFKRKFEEQSPNSTMVFTQFSQTPDSLVLNIQQMSAVNNDIIDMLTHIEAEIKAKQELSWEQFT